MPPRPLTTKKPHLSPDAAFEDEPENHRLRKGLFSLLLFADGAELFLGELAVLVLVLATESLLSLGCVFLGLGAGEEFFLAEGAVAVGVELGESLGWIGLWLFLLGVAFSGVHKAGEGQNGEDRGDNFHVDDVGVWFGLGLGALAKTNPLRAPCNAEPSRQFHNFFAPHAAAIVSAARIDSPFTTNIPRPRLVSRAAFW
jgi:hypothetical protein